MAKGKNQHIVPTDNGWAIKGEGNSRATRTFNTKEEALEAGKQIAKNQKAELIIHGKDGAIQSQNSYGKDPSKSKG